MESGLRRRVVGPQEAMQTYSPQGEPVAVGASIAGKAVRARAPHTDLAVRHPCTMFASVALKI